MAQPAAIEAKSATAPIFVSVFMRIFLLLQDDLRLRADAPDRHVADKRDRPLAHEVRERPPHRAAFRILRIPGGLAAVQVKRDLDPVLHRERLGLDGFEYLKYR